MTGAIATPETSLTLSNAAMQVLHDWSNDDTTDARSFAQSLVALIALGGYVYVESPTLLVASTRFGITVGMHRDREGVVSLNS